MLQSLKEMVCGHYPLARYQQLFSICFEGLDKHSSVKIQIISLLTICKFLGLFVNELEGSA